MKNVIRGGLRSLIPNREVKDADDILDELEDEEVAQGEMVEEEVKKVVVQKSKKVNILSDDEEFQEAEKTEDEESEPEEADVEEAAMPESPKVSPLHIDTDDNEEELEGGTDKENIGPAPSSVSARQVSVKAAVKKTEKAVSKLKVAKELEPEEVSAKKTTAAEDIWDKHEGDVRHVLVKEIKINPNQPRRRFEEVEMEDLKRSIAQHGILQPLVVRATEDGVELVAGERRLRAARDLGWDKVPCVVRRDVSSGASRLELALIENIQREDLNPVEEALAYQQLNEEYGMTHEEIGERVGRSRVSVTNIIRVLQLPLEIQKGLTDGKISSGHAKAILMIPDDEKQLRFYRHLVEEGLTVRKAETRARRIQRTMRLDDPVRSRRRGRSVFEEKFSGLLEDRYGHNARLRFDEHKNRYEVTFRCFSKEEIDELVGRLMGTESLPTDEQDKDVIDSE